MVAARVEFLTIDLPVIPWPGSWYVTVDSWHLRVKGESSRFEATANVSEPSRAPSLSYVREDKAVPMEIAGERGEIGGVEPIGIETWAENPDDRSRRKGKRR